MISPDTGGTIIDLCGTLFCILIAFSFVFLSYDCGIMNFWESLQDLWSGPYSMCPAGVCRPDRLLVRRSQRGGDPYQRTVYERILYKTRSRIYYGRIFPWYLYPSVLWWRKPWACPEIFRSFISVSVSWGSSWQLLLPGYRPFVPFQYLSGGYRKTGGRGSSPGERGSSTPGIQL